METYTKLEKYQTEITAELSRILSYWMQYAQDDINGGITGKIDHDNHGFPNTPKGSVLHARVLWTFSSAYNLQGDKKYLGMAERAYIYIMSHFADKEHGGFYWTVDHAGKPFDTKKQVYANAFVLYGLTEYYRASGNEQVKETAVNLYRLLVEKTYDSDLTGYFEAFSRDWQSIDDLRLSAKDVNEKKTMNTHLHVLEAYTNLYRIWPDSGLKEQIIKLLRNFIEHIVDPISGHLVLFLDEEWNKRSDTISYGHDIEAAWLLLEAAEVIEDVKLINDFKALAIVLADAAMEGLDKDYGLWYEYEPVEKKMIKQKHWWVQAEAMVGFYNAFQITREEKYASLSIKIWEYVKHHILDMEKGEWVWGIGSDGEIMPGEDKVGLWKCPYHNGRACIEIINRVQQSV